MYYTVIISTDMGEIIERYEAVTDVYVDGKRLDLPVYREKIITGIKNVEKEFRVLKYWKREIYLYTA